MNFRCERTERQLGDRSARALRASSKFGPRPALCYHGVPRGPNFDEGARSFFPRAATVTSSPIVGSRTSTPEGRAQLAGPPLARTVGPRPRSYPKEEDLYVQLRCTKSRPRPRRAFWLRCVFHPAPRVLAQRMLEVGFEDGSRRERSERRLAADGSRSPTWVPLQRSCHGRSLSSQVAARPLLLTPSKRWWFTS